MDGRFALTVLFVVSFFVVGKLAKNVYTLLAGLRCDSITFRTTFLLRGW